jgi:hypothetical protein
VLFLADNVASWIYGLPYVVPGCSCGYIDNLAYQYKMLSWNVSGLNSGARQQEVKQTISLINPDLVCIQETKLSDISSTTARNALGP